MVGAGDVVRAGRPAEANDAPLGDHVLSVGLPAKMLSGYAAIWSSVVFWPALAHKWFYGAVVGAERLLKAMH